MQARGQHQIAIEDPLHITIRPTHIEHSWGAAAGLVNDGHGATAVRVALMPNAAVAQKVARIGDGVADFENKWIGHDFWSINRFRV